MPITVNGVTVKTNAEGFLLDSSVWTSEVAEKIGDAHGVELTDAHWEVIRLVRDYCAEGNEPPSMRTLVKQVKI